MISKSEKPQSSCLAIFVQCLGPLASNGNKLLLCYRTTHFNSSQRHQYNISFTLRLSFITSTVPGRNLFLASASTQAEGPLLSEAAVGRNTRGTVG